MFDLGVEAFNLKEYVTEKLFYSYVRVTVVLGKHTKEVFSFSILTNVAEGIALSLGSNRIKGSN